MGRRACCIIRSAFPCIRVPPRAYQLDDDLVITSSSRTCRLTAKRPKNVSKEDTTGETMGRIHMERQDFNKLELRKTRAHKAERRASNKGEEGADDEAEGAGAGSKRARDEDEEEEDEE